MFPKRPPPALGWAVAVAEVEDPNSPVPAFGCAEPNSPPAEAMLLVLPAVDVAGFAEVLPEPKSPPAAGGWDIAGPL